MAKTKSREKKGSFNIRKFRFDNEQINSWVNTGGNIEYYYEVKKTNIVPLNQNEGLLSFTFRLEEKPIGEIKFNGDCILTSPTLKNHILILIAKKNSEIRKKNQSFMKILNKTLLAVCLDHSKKTSEKEGFNLIGFDTLLSNLGLENISFKDQDNKIFELKGDKLIEKKSIGNINNKIKERSEKNYIKHTAHYPKPVNLKNLTINGVFYRKIVFKDVIVHSKEKVPPNCLSLPKIYKVSILEYNPKKMTAKLFVEKRK